MQSAHSPKAGPNSLAPGDSHRARSALPAWTIDDIQASLRTYDRKPFQDLLAVWVDAAPDIGTLRKWAQKYPDRWAQAISHLSRVAGFSERRELTMHKFDPGTLSDSQLEDQIAALAGYMGIDAAQILEAVHAVMIEGSTVDVTPSPKADVTPPPQAASEQPSPNNKAAPTAHKDFIDAVTIDNEDVTKD